MNAIDLFVALNRINHFYDPNLFRSEFQTMANSHGFSDNSSYPKWIKLALNSAINEDPSKGFFHENDLVYLIIEDLKDDFNWPIANEGESTLMLFPKISCEIYICREDLWPNTFKHACSWEVRRTK